MKHGLRVTLIVVVILGISWWAIPKAWQAVFPTPTSSTPSTSDTPLDSGELEAVNESLALLLGELGLGSDDIITSEEITRELEGYAWIFTRTEVALPSDLDEDRIHHATARLPDEVDAFLTQPDELSISLRIYLGKTPVHQLLMFRPLDPAPPIDPGAPPRLAIVIEGVGLRSEAVEQLIHEPLPLTVAVLPYGSHSLRYATDAAQASKEVLVQLTFDHSAPEESAGMARPSSLDLSMDPAQFRQRALEDMEAVPYTSGVVIRSNTPTTSDAARMESLASLLADQNLFLLDGQPAADGVALQMANRQDVPSGIATATLNGNQDEHSLLRLRNLASLRGEAILMVQLEEGVDETLRSFVEERQAEGYRFVFASELIDRR